MKFLTNLFKKPAEPTPEPEATPEQLQDMERSKAVAVTVKTIAQRWQKGSPRPKGRRELDRVASGDVQALLQIIHHLSLRAVQREGQPS